MSKNINVEGHIARYKDTDPQEIAALIKGLTQLLEDRRVETIRKYKEHLAILEAGEIPAEEKAATPERKPRTKKAKETEA